MDKMTDAGNDGQYIGDAPEEFFQQLRKQLESRVAHWLRIGHKGPVAAVLPMNPAGPSPSPLAGGAIRIWWEVSCSEG